MPEGAEDSDSGSDDEAVPTDLRRPAADGSVRNGDGDVGTRRRRATSAT